MGGFAPWPRRPGGGVRNSKRMSKSDDDDNCSNDDDDEKLSEVDVQSMSFAILPPLAKRKADLELGTFLNGYGRDWLSPIPKNHRPLLCTGRGNLEE